MRITTVDDRCRLCFSILRLIPKSEITEQLEKLLQTSNIQYPDIKGITSPWDNAAIVEQFLYPELESKYDWVNSQFEMKQKHSYEDITCPQLDFNFVGDIAVK